MPKDTEITPVRRAIAIVGRPNVGKSALFNRLAKRRIAIVHEESGVTRDRLVCQAHWYEHQFDIIDTGGIGMIDRASSANEIEAGTRAQVDVAIADAAVLVFVVDATAGVVPLDQEVARILHASGRVVVCAANKADTEAHDGLATDFQSLGFPVVPISALHNRGIDDLLAIVIKHLPKAPPPENTTPLRVAVVGRPNVGKSSYINRILRNDRVIVSEVPGTTRDSIEIPFSVGKGPTARHYLLIDTAGLKKSGRVKSPVETFSMMRTQKAIEDCDIAVLMLDAQEGPKAKDRHLAGLIIEQRKGCVVVVNKWDLAENTGVTQRAYLEGLSEAFPFLGHTPMVFTSAKSGFNIRNTLDALDAVALEVQKELSTGILNRILREAMERKAPPVYMAKRMKFYYATQTGKAPITLRLFVNEPRGFKSNYMAYLEHVLRKTFGLEGAPIVFQLRARREDRKKD